jgi:hypothetical protein
MKALSGSSPAGQLQVELNHNAWKLVDVRLAENTGRELAQR